MGFSKGDIVDNNGNLKIKSINQEVIDKAEKALSAKIIDDVASRRKVLQVPSNMFWANNLKERCRLLRLGISTVSELKV